MSSPKSKIAAKRKLSNRVINRTRVDTDVLKKKVEQAKKFSPVKKKRVIRKKKK